MCAEGVELLVARAERLAQRDKLGFVVGERLGLLLERTLQIIVGRGQRAKLRLKLVGKALRIGEFIALLLESSLDCTDGAGQLVDAAVDGRQVVDGSARVRRCHFGGLGSGHCVFS